MSREQDFKTVLEADAPLMAILTGGVWANEDLNREGITRDNAADAFGADGYLQPTALVSQRGLIPDGEVADEEASVFSTRQVVEVWLYQDRGYDQIDAAMARIFTVLFGHKFTGAFPLGPPLNVMTRQVDQGALMGAKLERVDWLVYEIQGD